MILFVEVVKVVTLKCFLIKEECKYIAKEKKKPKYITDDLEISSNEENYCRKNSDQE